MGISTVRNNRAVLALCIGVMGLPILSAWTMGGCAFPGDEVLLDLAVATNLADPATPRLEEVETGELSFADSAALAHLGDGWRATWHNVVRFNDAVWSTSIVADLGVTVLDPRDRTLSLRLIQYACGEDQLPPQHIDVLWNGQPLGECAFPENAGWNPTEFQLSVPGGAQIVGENTISFLSRYAVSQKEMEGEGYDDPFSFGLCSLSLGPAREGAATFTGNAIEQAPMTRMKIPFWVPDSGPAALRFGMTEAAPGSRAFLRWDTLEGPRTHTLTEAAGGFVQVDLARHGGEPVELILDTTGVEGNQITRWAEPAVLVPRDTSPASGASQALPQNAPQHPKKVVLVLLDALRADAMGCYGALRDTTPFMDQLAREGVVFDRVYAAAPYTYSSTWSLLTSLYPRQHGSPTTPYRPGVEATTLQETLGNAGITTGFISANPWSPDTLVDEGFDTFISTLEKIYTSDNPTRDPGIVTNAALNFIEEHRDDSFFLYVHYMHPHDPYFPPEPFLHHFTEDPSPTLRGNADSLQAASFGKLGVTREDALQVRARYDENLLSVDAEVKRVFEGIQAAGLGEETVVIITADHGEAFMEHGVFSHNLTVYEEMVHIPLILHGPGIRNALSPRIREVASNVDTFPTICGLFGVQSPSTIEGRDLLEAAPHLTGVRAYAQTRFDESPREAYWWDRFKIIRDDFSRSDSMFDLVNDPSERVDLASVFPVLTDALLAEGKAWRSRLLSNTVAPREDVVISPDRAAELEALGYLR